MKIFKSHPAYKAAEKVYHTLKANGYIVLLAGGCVRDALLKIPSQDFDVASSARPEEVEKLFPKTVAVGKAFGVILVVEDGIEIEVASFRDDGHYVDGRRPSEVSFSTPERDAQRRDFTINALFYDIDEKKVIDFVEGQKDLKKKLIRAVGDARARFQEDHLRILRAIRFAAKLGFKIERGTWIAVCENADLVKTVSGERINEEMTKLLIAPKANYGLELLLESKVLHALFPEVKWQWKLFKAVTNYQDAWIQFFIWAVKCGATQSQIDLYMEKYRFSTDDKRAIKKTLRWFFEKGQLFEKPVGEIVSLIFDPFEKKGFELIKTRLTKSELVKWKKASALRKKWKKPPPPLLTAADLPRQIQGKDIGLALRAAQWAQLEGRIKTKKQALEWSLKPR